MSITRGLKRNALLCPDATATVFGQRHTTWRQLGDRVARSAGALRDLGLRPGTRIAILALNSDRYVELLFATAWAGGTVVPLNIRLAAAELLFQLEDSGAEVLVLDDAFLPLLPALRGCAGLKRVVHIGAADPGPGSVRYEALVAGAAGIPDACCRGDELSGIFYTGGTTGRARGVMLSHDNLVMNALCSLQGTGLTRASVFLQIAPMFHMSSNTMLHQVVLAGGSQLILPRFEPKATLDAIVEHRATAMGAVPVMLQMMLGLLDASPGRYDLGCLKTAVYGGAPIAEAILVRLLEKFPATGFIQVYGQTELSPIATLLPAANHVVSGPGAGKLRAAGRPIHHVAVRIADEDDRDVPAGSVGQILVQSPGMMQGYWKLPEETAEALRGGWMHTGDAGYVDEDGYLFIVDRVKDMIVSGGENIYTIEVENALARHPGVAMCAVFGIPSDQWGEVVHAVVIPMQGVTLTEAELAAHCHNLIAGYKHPRSWEIRSDPLPLSGAGKILKHLLRAPYWKGKTRQVN